MPEEYKTEEQLKQEAKARREQAAQIPQKPRTEAQKKRENFWYHYKWQTIGVTLAVVLIVFFLRDTVFRTKPDITVVMIAGTPFGQDEIGRLTHAMEDVLTDFNGDGKISANIDFIFMPADEEFQDYASQMKMVAVITAAADPVYLLDEESFDMLLEMSEGVSIFEELSAPAGTLGVTGFEGLSFYIRKSESFLKTQDYYGYCENFLLSSNGRLETCQNRIP